MRVSFVQLDHRHWWYEQSIICSFFAGAMHSFLENMQTRIVLEIPAGQFDETLVNSSGLMNKLISIMVAVNLQKGTIII